MARSLKSENSFSFHARTREHAEAVGGCLASVVRNSHGRLLAILAKRTRDIAASEDALAHAYRKALERWLDGAIPEKPEAWLLAVARNQLIDCSRSAFARTSMCLFGDDGEALEFPSSLSSHEGFFSGELDEEQLGDERLGLMFAAAHPLIDEAVRAPLIMQTVLGLEAHKIARLLCVPEPTLTQRLVRAKAKIRSAGIPFAVPDRESWGPRLDAVLEAIYGAFTASFNHVTSEKPGMTHGLGLDALSLAELLAKLLPEEPEALGLAALLAFSVSRLPARFSPAGDAIPLDRQDTSLWDASLMDRAFEWLKCASRHGKVGRFQLEAAVQAVHADRKRSGETNWPVIVALYDGLLRYSPARGMLVARAYAISRVRSAQAGLKALEMIPVEELQSFAPALFCRAQLLAVMQESSGNQPSLSAC